MSNAMQAELPFNTNPASRSTAKYRGLSMFTGVGGLDFGMESASKKKLSFDAWVEIDEDCRSTLIQNFPKIRKNQDLLFRDASKVSPGMLMQAIDISPGELFVLAGGPPCQAFSTAGLRQSLKDSRGSMVESYFAMVRKLQPRFFVFENVRGLLSAAIKHRQLKDREHPQEVAANEDEQLGSVFHRVVMPRFKRMGYEVIYGVVNAADYGSAQVRHRVIIMGSRDREFRAGVFRKQTSHALRVNDLLPPTHHSFAPYAPIKPWKTLREAIGHLDMDPPLSETYTYSRERALIFKQMPMGKNWKYVRDNPKKFPKGYLEKIMGGAINSGGGKEGYYRRLHWDRPTPTLTCQPQQLATSLCHPERERPLSIAEYAALQDFPARFVFAGSKSSQYQQIGNAVPVNLSKAIGKLLLTIAGE